MSDLRETLREEIRLILIEGDFDSKRARKIAELATAAHSLLEACESYYSTRRRKATGPKPPTVPPLTKEPVGDFRCTHCSSLFATAEQLQTHEVEDHVLGGADGAEATKVYGVVDNGPAIPGAQS